MMNATSLHFHSNVYSIIRRSTLTTVDIFFKFWELGVLLVCGRMWVKLAKDGDEVEKSAMKEAICNE